MAEKKTKQVPKPRSKRKTVEKAEPQTLAPPVPEGLCQLSELDLLKFLRTDNELHNHKLEIKNLEQAQMLEDREFEQRRAERKNRIRLLQQSIRQREVEQKQLLQEFGKRYGFDATIASIDDQTGVVHEHPQKG